MTRSYSSLSVKTEMMGVCLFAGSQAALLEKEKKKKKKSRDPVHVGGGGGGGERLNGTPVS